MVLGMSESLSKKLCALREGIASCRPMGFGSKAGMASGRSALPGLDQQQHFGHSTDCNAWQPSACRRWAPSAGRVLLQLWTLPLCCVALSLVHPLRPIFIAGHRAVPDILWPPLTAFARCVVMPATVTANWASRSSNGDALFGIKSMLKGIWFICCLSMCCMRS